MVLVSNNRYRLGRAVGSGTRPRIDDGLLGDHRRRRALGARRGGRRLQRPWREWSAPTFEVDADRPIAAGIDGEALVLDPPLSFRIRPGVLRVRIARQHPGASPSAHGSRGRPGRRGRAGPDRARPPPETRNVNDQGGPNGPDRDHREGAAEPRGRRRPPARPRRHARRHNDVEFDRGGMHFKVRVPDEVDFKLEIEIDDDERELEIELKW